MHINTINYQLSLSVIVPSFNEAENILETIENVYKALGGLKISYEVIVIDDGSSDGTYKLVENNLKNYNNLKLIKNNKNCGFGHSYKRGVQLAKMEYTVMVHGDNAWGHATLFELFEHLGKADVIIGHTKNMWRSRHWTRTLISKTFTMLMNLIFNRNLIYYNGLQIHNTKVLQDMDIFSDGYVFQSEVLLKGLENNKTYIEVGMDLVEREKGVSKAFKINNILEVFSTIWKLKSNLNYSRTFMK